MSIFLPVLIILLFIGAIISFIKSYNPSLLSDMNKEMQDMGETCEPAMCIVLFLILSSGAIFSIADFVLSFDNIIFIITTVAVVLIMIIMMFKMREIMEPVQSAGNQSS